MSIPTFLYIESPPPPGLIPHTPLVVQKLIIKFAGLMFHLFVGCSEALGMESEKIHDSQLSSFSQFSNAWSPSEGRLNNNGAWCSYSNAVNEFFGIDLLEVRHVSIIATQGYEGQYRHNFVRTFMIEYSYDGVSWLFYKDRNGQNKVLDINPFTPKI